MKKIFKISHYKSMGANDPRSYASLDHRGLIDRICVVDHYTLLHTKYIRSGPHGFREEDFFLSFGPQGHMWQDLCRKPLNIASYLIY